MRVFIRSAAAVAVAALFPVIGAAQPQPPQGPPPPGGGRGGARAAQPTRQAPDQLSEQQREQMRTFDEQHRQAAETGRRELDDLHRQLNEALTSAQVDNGKVTQLRNQIVQKETALAQHRLDRLTKLSSILTPEQRQNLRGRGLGAAFGRGGAGGGGVARGGVMARPGDAQGRPFVFQGGRGRMGQPGPGGVGRPGAVGRGGGGGARGNVMRRFELRTARPGQLRGGRGAAPGGRVMLPQRRGGDTDLREEIRRLEMQLEVLRRRIGR